MPSPFPNHYFGECVARAQQYRGLKSSEAAEQLGISLDEYDQLKKGLIRPVSSFLKTLSKVFDISYEKIAQWLQELPSEEEKKMPSFRTDSEIRFLKILDEKIEKLLLPFNNPNLKV